MNEPIPFSNAHGVIKEAREIVTIQEREFEPLELDISEVFIKSFRKLKPLVKKVLKKNPHTRNNDNLLVLACWREEYYPDFKVVIGRTREVENKLTKQLEFQLPVDMISFLRSAESITRARRSLTSDAYKKGLKTGDFTEFKDLIPTDKRVIEVRKLREKSLHEFFSRREKGGYNETNN